MAQFQVPQFIETEDKIVGPLTLKQFLYLAAAGGIAFLLFFFVKLWLWLIFAAIFGFIAAMFAFIRINGQPLATILYRALKYYWQPRLYLWQKKRAEETEREAPEEEIETEGPIRPKNNVKTGGITLKFGGIKELWQQLLTSRNKLKREKTKPAKYVAVEKSNGEKVAVKRVDYL
ncbi:MAG: PrgI family protein [Parcubacteria group bacterium]|nr:PrgI family protein [Parcubacteria group bacterium]